MLIQSREELEEAERSHKNEQTCRSFWFTSSFVTLVVFPPATLLTGIGLAVSHYSTSKARRRERNAAGENSRALRHLKQKTRDNDKAKVSDD